MSNILGFGNPFSIIISVCCNVFQLLEAIDIQNDRKHEKGRKILMQSIFKSN